MFYASPKDELIVQKARDLFLHREISRISRESQPYRNRLYDQSWYMAKSRTRITIRLSEATNSKTVDTKENIYWIQYADRSIAMVTPMRWWVIA